jgi:D-proline reductase (dithiol) PrdB
MTGWRTAVPESQFLEKQMTDKVDSYRFLNGLTRRTVKSWIKLETPRQIPWTAVKKPLCECALSLISSAGLALRSDPPFDQKIERENPWYGDPSYRVIPQTARTADVKMYHLHVDPFFVEQDLNCLLPVEPLCDLEVEGVIGCAAEKHYSFMGYTVQPVILLEKSVPRMIEELRDEQIDLVVLVPA